MFHSTSVSKARGAAALLLACLAGTMGCEDLPTDTPSTDGPGYGIAVTAAPLGAAGGNGKGGGGGNDGGGGSGGPSTITSLAITVVESDLNSDNHGDYLDGKCGVKAIWDVDTSFLSFRPVDNGLNRKDEKDIAEDPDCDGVYPRFVDVDLVNAPVRGYCVNPASGDACTAEELVPPPPGTILGDLADPNGEFGGIVDMPDGETITSLGARLAAAGDDGDPTTAPGSVNTAYCLDDGRGRPFRFDPGRNAGSNEYAVTRAADGRPTRIETQPWPNNVGSCLHTRSDGAKVLLLLEMDFAVDIEEASGS